MTISQSDNPSRQSLRRHYRQCRAALGSTEREAAHSAIYRQLDNIVARYGPARVFAYLAQQGKTQNQTPEETDITAWLNAQRLPIAVPLIEANKTMTFRAYQSNNLQTNSLGIPEPSADAAILTPEDSDLLLMPLVAYDTKGNRLGMGGGYYDRYLSALPGRPLLVGIAYACQQHPTRLPAESWDIPLHAVITEAGLQTFPHETPPTQ